MKPQLCSCVLQGNPGFSVQLSLGEEMCAEYGEVAFR